MVASGAAEYRVHEAKNRANLLFGRLFVVLGPLLLIYSVYRVAAAGGDGEPGSLVYLCGGTGLLLLLMGAFALWEQRRDRSVSVRVDGDGLVYAHKGKREVVRWNDIEEARTSVTAVRTPGSRVTVDTVYGFAITRRNGPALRFSFNKNTVPNIEELRARIEQEVG